MQEYKKEFIEFVAKNGILHFDDFTLKSGRKSPYFFNLGECKTGEGFNKIGEYYADNIAQNIDTTGATLFGFAYKGIPLVAVTALKLAEKYNIDLPVCYNRKEAKDHGEGGMFIGAQITDDSKIIVIDDVIAAGTAMNEAKAMLGDRIIAAAISADRCEAHLEGDKMTALESISVEHGFRIFPIVTIYEVVEYLYNRNVDGVVYIDDNGRRKIEEYLKKYGAKE